MKVNVFENQTIAASGSALSSGISLPENASSFSLFYTITGTGQADFFLYASHDGSTFTKITRSIKRGATVGSNIIHFPVIPCDAFKIGVEESGASAAVVVTMSIVTRPGKFGDWPVYDGVTSASTFIDYSHHEIHDERYFTALHSATSKNDGETISIYFKTPNTTRRCHLFAKWSSGGAAYFKIYEAPTVTANTGTNGQSIFNHYRDSSVTSGVVDNATSPAANKMGIDCTVTNTGTTIWQDYSGAAKSSAGSSRNEDEMVLKKNTAYVFLVESDAAGIALNLILSWYEHIDR